MVSKRKIATTAASFGAAMTAIYAAPELQAQIVDLTWLEGNATATNPFFNGTTTNPPGFGIDQVPDQSTSGGALIVDFNQWNDTYGDGTGRTINIGGGRNILSATAVALGQSLDPATFAGSGSSGAVGIIGGTEFDGSGSNYVGFRAIDGNVGWFKLDYTIDGPIIYSDGEFAQNGETVVVGGTGGGGGFVPPATFTTFRGTVLSATLADFVDSDDVRAQYNPGFTINNTEAPVWLVFDAVAANAISFRVESNAGTPSLTYTVEAWNWNTNSYDEIGTQAEAFNTDGVLDFNITPADHVDGAGNVRSRVGWRKTGFTINFPWEVRVDQVGWNE